MNRVYFAEEDDRNENALKGLNRLLVVVLVALLVVFVGGTAVAIANNGGVLSPRYRRVDPTPKQVVNSSLRSKKSVSAYTELGQIRTVTKGEGEAPGTLLVITPWFSYPSVDTQLYEELSQKKMQEKSIVIGCISSHTKKELLEMGEQAVKDEIRDRINAALILGKIENVYFDEYLFFE